MKFRERKTILKEAVDLIEEKSLTMLRTIIIQQQIIKVRDDVRVKEKKTLKTRESYVRSE